MLQAVCQIDSERHRKYETFIAVYVCLPFCNFALPVPGITGKSTSFQADFMFLDFVDSFLI